MTKPKTIFLIGMMGSGKSTFGRLLAPHLGLPFLDTDTIIEQKEKCLVAALFEQKGEVYFRTLEQQVIEKLPNAPHVVACGGGLPCFENNLNLLKQKGLVVCLAAPPKVLFDRIKHEDSRPLLSDWLGFEQLYTTRKACYQKADIQLNAALSLQELLTSFEKSAALYYQ